MQFKSLTVAKLKERLPHMSDLSLGRMRKMLTKGQRGEMSDHSMALCAWLSVEYKRRGYHAGTQLLPISEQRERAGGDDE